MSDCAGWLEDAAYFAAVDDAMNTSSWYEWPEPLKHRHVAALEEIYQSKKEFVRSLDPLALLTCFWAFLKYAFLLQIDIFIAQQFLFQRQWQKVRDYAQMKGISIMGDMPIYVGYHSADVWANKKQFLLVRLPFIAMLYLMLQCFYTNLPSMVPPESKWLSSSC